MTAQHTPGRAYLSYAVLDDQTPGPVTVFVGEVPFAGHLSAADARRLAACWNACEGVLTQNLENFPGVLALSMEATGITGTSLEKVVAERDQLRAELNEARVLLAAKYDLPPGDNPGAIAIVAERLTRLSTFLGVVLTITQRPRAPLAMGNYDTVISVRPARVMA